MILRMIRHPELDSVVGTIRSDTKRLAALDEGRREWFHRRKNCKVSLLENINYGLHEDISWLSNEFSNDAIADDDERAHCYKFRIINAHADKDRMEGWKTYGVLDHDAHVLRRQQIRDNAGIYPELYNRWLIDALALRFAASQDMSFDECEWFLEVDHFGIGLTDYNDRPIEGVRYNWLIRGFCGIEIQRLFDYDLASYQIPKLDSLYE